MKVVVKTIHGSKLYGTDHANSDTDLKCIFSKSLSELITDAPDYYREHTPNDTEFFSLRKYALLLSQQQTNAIEMLFTPKEFIIETSPAWEELRANKGRLVSRNIMPFVGYAKQQARVYSEKGHSLNMLHDLFNDLNRWLKYHSHDSETKAIEYTDGDYPSIELPNLLNLYPNLINRGEKLSNNGVEIPYFQILNKQFECLCPVLEWHDRIKHMINNYGERAKDAAANGAFDRKAMYHAVRIIDEAVELLETGNLILPRVGTILPLLRGIRFDDNISFEEAQETLMGCYDYLMNTALPKSTLQENIDKDYLDTWFKTAQATAIRKELLLG